MSNHFQFVAGTLPSDATVTLVIPGWGTDCQIFRDRIPQGSHIISTPFDPRSYVSDLSEFLANESLSITRIVGFSMGARLATDVARALNDPSIVLRLIGARPIYSSADTAPLRPMLSASPAQFLSQFYRGCFARPSAYDQFTSIVGPDYADRFPLPALLAGFDYLESTPFSVDGISPEQIRLIHGDYDRIAPIDEITQFADTHSIALHRVPREGHIVWELESEWLQ